MLLSNYSLFCSGKSPLWLSFNLLLRFGCFDYVLHSLKKVAGLSFTFESNICLAKSSRTGHSQVLESPLVKRDMLNFYKLRLVGIVECWHSR